MTKEEQALSDKSSKRPAVRVISPGLVNLGNTCFANSSLQVLAAAEPLHNVLSTTSDNPTPEGQLTTPFVGLMRKIYRSQSQQSLNPKELYNTFVKKYTYFKPYTQQDAQEFLRFLLEGLKSEVPPPPAPDSMARPNMKRTRRRTLVTAGTEDNESHEKSANNETQQTYIDHLFGGKLASYVVCDVCKSVSTSYEDFQDISLPIHDADSPHLRKRDRFRAQFLRTNTLGVFNQHKYSQSTSAIGANDQEDAGGMASDVGGYLSSGGNIESGHHSERRSFDEGDRKKVALGRKFAKLSLTDNQSRDASPAAVIPLRLEPWGQIPDPPKERHEYIKKLLNDSAGENVLSRLLGGDASHHHHHTRAPSPSPSPLSRSSSLSRGFSLRGDKNPVPKTSLTDCFKRFTSVEVLDGDNKFACEECAKFLYPRRGSTKVAPDSSDSDDDVSMHSPEAITTPVAPIRKARRRTLTLEKKESRGRARNRDTSPAAEPESSDSDIADDEDGDLSEVSSKTSLPTTIDSTIPIVEISDLSTGSPLIAEPPPSGVTIPRPSIATAPPRYILRKAFKRMKLQNPLPPIMILHLKRFYGTYSGSMKKIDDFVSFEPEFDFAPFVFPPSPKKSKILYRLTGVVIHLGSINSGHYVSYFYTHKTLPPLSDGEKSKKNNVVPDSEYLTKEEPGQGRREWVYASDTAVRAASLDEVLRARAYLLVYEKI